MCKEEKKPLDMKLQCPLPKFDFDMITLGHGSGGMLTNNLLDTSILKLLGNDFLDDKHDGATLQIEEKGKMAFSTDSYTISPIFFPNNNIGELAINGTVNDLAMCGAMAKYLSLSFIIEEGLKMSEFWDILVSIKQACQEANVKIVTGDTKVVEKGKGDKIFINTSGIGIIHPKSNIHIRNIQQGDKIIINGNIATHGMAIMSAREGLEFESEIVSDTTNLNHTVISMIEKFGHHIHLLTDPTRGGVATVLKEIAEKSRLGIHIVHRELPIDIQVESACELLGLDPLYVANEGLFLSIVSAEKAEEYLDFLRKDKKGKEAKIIGEIVKENQGQVVLESSMGGKRMINMLPGEQLPRIC